MKCIQLSYLFLDGGGGLTVISFIQISQCILKVKLVQCGCEEGGGGVKGRKTFSGVLNYWVDILSQLMSCFCVFRESIDVTEFELQKNAIVLFITKTRQVYTLQGNYVVVVIVNGLHKNRLKITFMNLP